MKAITAWVANRDKAIGERRDVFGLTRRDRVHMLLTTAAVAYCVVTVLAIVVGS